MKCNDCYLRYYCDEQTAFICKHNDYCKYMPEQNIENQNNKRLTKSGAVSQRDINKLFELSNENQFGANNAYYKLKYYEDLEEQGRLIILSVQDVHPCKICNTGWGSISSEGCYDCEETCVRLKQYNEKYSK